MSWIPLIEGFCQSVFFVERALTLWRSWDEREHVHVHDLSCHQDTVTIELENASVDLLSIEPYIYFVGITNDHKLVKDRVKLDVANRILPVCQSIRIEVTSRILRKQLRFLMVKIHPARGLPICIHMRNTFTADGFERIKSWQYWREEKLPHYYLNWRDKFTNH